MENQPEPVDRGSERISDADRQAKVRQIQEAMAKDLVRFDQLDERFEAVYRAQTRGELEAVVHDLPAPAPNIAVPAHPVSPTNFSVLGDVKVGGWIDADKDLSCATLFGDVVVDLSTANLTRDITVTARTVFGDIVVIVPDGARAVMQALHLLGDRKEDLSPPLPGAPTITVVAQQVFGDSKLYSLSRVPEGPFRRLWRALRS